jgi:predicted Holliday junction resolvase-like endonuclease
LPDVVTQLISVVIILVVFLSVVLFLFLRRLPYRYTEEELKDRIKKSLEQQLYSVKGANGEQIAPHMKEFLEKYEPADARFLGGKPVDYIVYKGYSRVYDTNEPIEEIVFLEIKTSKEEKRGLNKNEAKIREAINAKRIRHEVITIHLEP